MEIISEYNVMHMSSNYKRICNFVKWSKFTLVGKTEHIDYAEPLGLKLCLFAKLRWVKQVRFLAVCRHTTV